MSTSRFMRSVAALLLALTLAFASLPAFAVGQSTSMASRGDKYYVTVNDLNFRRGPGTQYGVITKLDKGTALTYVSNVGGWWKVYTSSGRVGYVDRQYLTQDSTEKTGKYFVTATELNIRKQPKTSSGVLGKVRKGTIVTISKLNGDWGYLSAGANVKGWVALSYLSHINGGTTSSSSNKTGKPEAYVLYEVNTRSLNVRAGSSTNARRIDTLREGEDVYITKTDGNWVYIVYKESGKLKNGWVSFSYLSKK